MLKVIGKQHIDDLFTDIPDNLKLKNGLDLPKGLSELDVLKNVHALAAQNKGADQLTCFMGAGAYDSFVPTAVKHITGRSEFYTAYTPYQPEISQGTLQAIFEFQTMVAELTGMDAANASMYDGATACAEAAFMANAINNKKKIVVSQGVHPEAREVLTSYASMKSLEIVEVPLKDGLTDLEAVKLAAIDGTSAVIVQNPNFLGYIEPQIQAIGEHAHSLKALLIVSVADPLSLAITKTPGELGADIVVGEAQAFGSGLNYGGPYVGFMATTTKQLRKLPGRIVGESKDVDGKRAFVLTLQAREQHIRREKATSNICSNQALNALTCTVYLSLMGKQGLKEAALQSASKARYLSKALADAGIPTVFNQPFFREFPIKLSKDYASVMKALEDQGILGGYNLKPTYGELGLGDSMLLCVTEKRSKEELDTLITALKAILEV